MCLIESLRTQKVGIEKWIFFFFFLQISELQKLMINAICPFLMGENVYLQIEGKGMGLCTIDSMRKSTGETVVMLTCL